MLSCFSETERTRMFVTGLIRNWRFDRMNCNLEGDSS